MERVETRPDILQVKREQKWRNAPGLGRKGKTGCGLFDTHVGGHTKKQGKSVCGSSRKPQREWCWFGAMEIFRGPKRAAPPGKPQQ